MGMCHALQDKGWQFANIVQVCLGLKYNASSKISVGFTAVSKKYDRSVEFVPKKCALHFLRLYF